MFTFKLTLYLPIKWIAEAVNIYLNSGVFTLIAV